MPKRSKDLPYQIAIRQRLDAMLFEAEAHRLLDLIGAPAGKFINKRLADYARKMGKDPDAKPVKRVRRDRPLPEQQEL